jgi:hypothetical protein
MKEVCILLMSLALTWGTGAQDMHEGQASISGRVLNGSRTPCPAQIRVFQMLIRDGFADLISKCSTSTGQEGGFECPNLSGGKFIVQVLPLRRLGKQPQDTTEVTIPQSIFYPGVTDLELAATISLRNDEAGWAEVRVIDSLAVEITGRLTDPRPGASLRLKADSGGLTLDTGINPRYDSSTGRFVISSVPAGHYQVTADWFVGRAEQRATLPLVVNAAPVHNLLVSATSNVEMTGQLSALPSGATITQLILASTDGFTRDVSTPVKDGAFHFRPVPAGEYLLTLPPNQQVYVNAVYIGGKGSGGSRFTVTPGQTAVNLYVEAKGPSKAIRGSVKEWEGSAPRAEVVAQSEDSGEVYKVTTDKQRNFSFTGLKPGNYRLFAWPGVDTIEYRNSRILRKYDNDSTEVSIDEDSIASPIELSPIDQEH